MPVVIGVLSLILRVWAPGPVSQTQDEFNWLVYSDEFRGALVDRDFSHAAVRSDYTTLPGVTTMWSGTLGYASVALAHAVGLAEAPEPITGSVLRASRGFVALWCSIALGMLVAVASLLVGRRAAAVAGVLLATEPFLVGHSDVLHTDAMVTMFGAMSLVALAAGLRARRPVDPAGDGTDATATLRGARSGGRISLVVLSGAFAGLAILTKLNAVPLVVGGGAVIMTIELLAARRTAKGGAGCWRSALGENLRFVAMWGGTALLVMFVLWPALWVAPLEQLRHVKEALDVLSQAQNVTFFRHHSTTDPGVTYYPVAMLFRMTPWFLVGATISTFAVLFGFVRGFRRSPLANPMIIVAATLLLAAIPYALVASFTSQKYDRYFLPVLPFLAIACGVFVSSAVGRLESHFRSTRWVLPVGIVVTALLTVSTLSHAPYAISYVNPLPGGQVRARNNILLGWGEGLEVVGAEIRRREGRRCKEARILSRPFHHVAFPCGQLVSFAAVGRDLQNIDYYVGYVSSLQRSRRSDLDVYDAVRGTGDLIKTVEIGGVEYAELWKIRHHKP